MKNSELNKRVKTEKQTSFLEHRSQGYVKIPRTILLRCFSPFADEEKNICRLYLVLMLLCSYSERSVVVNGKEVPCKRGDYVGDYAELGAYVDMPKTTVRRLMIRLAERNLVEIERLYKGIKVQLIAYAAFLEATEPTRKTQQKVKTAEEAYAENIRKAQQGIFY